MPGPVTMRCGWLLVLALACAGAAGAGGLSVGVEPAALTVDRSFHLLLEADGDVRTDPDLSPLEKDFDVVAQTRSRIQPLGGRDARVRTTWRVELMPTRTGIFRIPALEAGALRSTPLRVAIGRADVDATADFLVEVDPDTQRPYAQQQVILTVRVLHTGNMTSSTLEEPLPEGVDALVQELGRGHYLDEPAIHGGRRYRVYQRHYAVFPQTPGTLVIPPLEMEARTRERGATGNGAAAMVTRHVRARSQAIRIPVQDAPEGAGRPWLPARTLDLREAWPPPGGAELSLGDTLARHLTIEAEGLAAAQLPELAPGLPEGIDQYPERPTLQDRAGSSGVTGTRSQVFTLVATRPGRYTLPAVSLDWWNTAARRAERAVLPSRTVRVVDAGAQAAAPPVGDAPGGARGAPAPWQWLSAALGLAWLLTLWRWRASRPRAGAAAPAPRGPGAAGMRRAMAAIEGACARHDAPGARDALLAWAAAAWPDAPPATLSQVARRQDGELAQALDGLQRALYDRRAPSWNGDRLRAAARRLQAPSAPGSGPEAPALEPLYRSRHTAP